jgi:hypothetical protein
MPGTCAAGSPKPHLGLSRLVTVVLFLVVRKKLHTLPHRGF